MGFNGATPVLRGMEVTGINLGSVPSVMLFDICYYS